MRALGQGRSRSRLRARALIGPAVVGSAWLVACSARPLPWPPGEAQQQVEIAFEQEAANQLDVLFVIDNSRSMEAEQANLIRNFPAFMEALKRLPKGLPDLHVGVVSTDVGTGVPLSGCTALGDRGVLQNRPRADEGACEGVPTDHFLRSFENGTRNNFAGDISQAFRCIAQLGARGCGFEQPLESARLALGGGAGGPPPENVGFLRRSAALALIFITDEDDCSAPTGLRFRGGGDNRQCQVLGTLCQGVTPEAKAGASYGSCHSNEGGPLNRVGDYVRFFRSLKRNPGKILVSVIAAPTSPYVMGASALEPSCSSPNGEGTPSVRMTDFVHAFGSNGVLVNICSDEFDVALTGIAEKLNGVLFSQCFPCPLMDVDADADGVQPICSVTDTTLGAGGRAETVLPPCAGDPGQAVTAACWRLAPASECDASGTKLTVDRPAGVAPDGLLTTAHCQACLDPFDPRCAH